MLSGERLTYYRHGIQEPFGFDFYTDDIAALLAHIEALERRLAAADAVVDAAREFTYDTSDSWAGKNGQQWFTVTLPVDDVSRLCAYLSQYDAAKGGE
jgi:hypothetical protein